MNIVVTSSKFKANDWYNSDGGVSYLNGCVNDKIIHTLDFYIEKTALLMRLKFDSTNKTITIANNINFDSFIKTYGYVVGEKITITDSVSNNAEFTITAITDRVITVSESLTNETAEGANIYLSSKIKAIDFYYNILNSPTGKADNFLSLIDKRTLQRYSVLKGLDASDTSTTHYFVNGTETKDWITDTFSGSNTEATIKGAGITDYKQKFTIVHTFYNTPIWTKDYLLNFQNRLAPDGFLYGNSPSYIYKIDAKYTWAAPSPIATITNYAQGNLCWYNQNVSRMIPDYSIDSITYIDADTSDVLTQMDFTKQVSFTIVLKSASGAFASNTQVILNNVFCSTNEEDYQFKTITQRQSLINDRAIMTVGAGAVNGEYYGTAYQYFDTCEAALTDANTVTITGLMKYSNTVIAYLKTLPTDAFNYALSATTQDLTITSSEDIDRVNVLCDFKSMDYDTRNPDLMQLVDYIRVYTFPDTGYNPKNSVNAYEGTPIIAEVPFQVNVASQVPTIKTVGMQIVAVKDLKTDFVIEEKTFSIPFVCKTDNVQEISISESRNYKGVPDIYNTSSLVNNSDYDDTDKIGYVLKHAFVLRYEDWITLVSNTCQDINANNAVITQRWANITGGWDLKLRFVADIEDEDGNITSFYAQVPISITKAGQANDTDLAFTTESYFLDEDGMEVDTLQLDATTKVVFIYTITPVDITALNVGSSVSGTLTYSVDITKTHIDASTLTLAVGTETFSDNGDGTMTGDAGGSATINYELGTVDVTCIADPGNGDILADFTYYPSFDNYPAMQITADLRNQNGGVTERLIASSFNDADSNSPWSAPDANETADISYADGNARVDMFGFDKIIVSSNYKNSVNNQVFRGDGCGNGTIGNIPTGVPSGGIVIGSSANNPPTTGPYEERLWQDNEPHLWNDLDPALFQ